MTRSALLATVLLAGSCATERHVSRDIAYTANAVASTVGIVHAAVVRYVPDATIPQTLTPHERAAVILTPAVVMLGIAVWNFVEQWRAAATAPDMGSAVDGGAP